MIRVAILGSTGSIGRSALEVMGRHTERFEVAALVANRSASELQAQVERFEPAKAAREIRIRLFRFDYEFEQRIGHPAHSRNNHRLPFSGALQEDCRDPAKALRISEAAAAKLVNLPSCLNHRSALIKNGSLHWSLQSAADQASKAANNTRSAPAGQRSAIAKAVPAINNQVRNENNNHA